MRRDSSRAASAGRLAFDSVRFGRFEFRPSVVPTILTICLLPVLVGLGFWQLDRAAQKRARFEEFTRRSEAPPVTIGSMADEDATVDALRFRPVIARGAFDRAHQYLLDNRTDGGRAGYHVLTPLRFAGRPGGVIVNRGWVPVGPTRTELPDISVSGDSVLVHGNISPPAPPPLLLGPSGYGAAGWPRVVELVDLGAMEKELGYRLEPYILRLAAADPDGYLRNWRPHIGIGPERHRAYAFQWFSLAGLLLVIYAVVNLRRIERYGSRP